MYYCKALGAVFDRICDLQVFVIIIFAIIICPFSHVQRRFFINHLYAKHCVGDAGWLTVVDGTGKGADVCDWTNKDIIYPAFLYSASSTMEVWSTGGKLVTGLPLLRLLHHGSVEHWGVSQ